MGYLLTGNVFGGLYEAIVWQFITSYGRDPAQVAAKYDLGYSGPMNGNGSVWGHAWRNHCKDFVHARVRFRRK